MLRQGAIRVEINLAFHFGFVDRKRAQHGTRDGRYVYSASLFTLPSLIEPLLP